MSDYVLPLADRHGAVTHARVLAHGVGFVRVDVAGITVALRELPACADTGEPAMLVAVECEPTLVGPWPTWTVTLADVRAAVPGYVSSEAPRAAKPRKRGAR